MEWNITRHASPNHSPQFGVYAGDEMYDFAIVRGADAAERVAIIAAAPDLLKACEDALEVEEDMAQCPDSELAKRLRAAIAKAKGNDNG